MDTTVQGLFSTLRESLQAASDVLPTDDSITAPDDGISLLDVKNELLLSYLHNLVFLILLKIRQYPASTSPDAQNELHDDVVKQLVELRVFLEKGVKPLEGRLKYQIDKVIRAADDSARNEAQSKGKPKAQSRKQRRNVDSEDDSMHSASGSDASESDEEIDELSYRPNPAAFRRPVSSTEKDSTKQSAADTNGVYKPPRIAATVMPSDRERGSRDQRPQRSAVLEDFVANELSTAPLAEPSIGSTIVSGGRHTKTERERREEAERKEYEETNFMRLPAQSKKEKARKAARDRGGFGNEEWRGIDAGLDRIDRLTQRKGGKVGQLARSRKRAVEDGPRGDGMQVGERFAKRRMMDKPKRKR